MLTTLPFRRSHFSCSLPCSHSAENWNTHFHTEFCPVQHTFVSSWDAALEWQSLCARVLGNQSTRPFNFFILQLSSMTRRRWNRIEQMLYLHREMLNAHLDGSFSAPFITFNFVLSLHFVVVRRRNHNRNKTRTKLQPDNNNNDPPIIIQYSFIVSCTASTFLCRLFDCNWWCVSTHRFTIASHRECTKMQLHRLHGDRFVFSPYSV